MKLRFAATGRDWSDGVMENGVMECWSNGVLGFPEPITPTFHYSITPVDSPLRRLTLLQLDLDDAPAFHVDDGELVAVVLDPFAAARDAF